MRGSADYFVKVPNSHYLRAWDLIRDVHCGKEVFLLDTAVREPHSLIINPSKPRGGNRLHKGEAVLVTNESMLWLVLIGKNSNDQYFARCESHSSRPSRAQDSVSRIPASVDPTVLAVVLGRSVAPRRRKVLAGSARNVQRRGKGQAPRSPNAGSCQVLSHLPNGTLTNNGQVQEAPLPERV